MKILYICNNISVPGNGICTSARNTSAALRAAGLDVRLLAGENADPDGIQPEFRLKRFYFPIFQPIIDANGFSYACIEKKTIREAVEWADIVHIEEPLPLEKVAMNMAEKMGKPITGTFHMYTENILSELPFINFRWSNRLLMKLWKKRYYDHMTDVQCPTGVVKNLLESCGFRARLHVISNGIEIPQERVIAKPYTGGPYRIIKIGRFASIKSPDLLLDAMKHSRHSKEIELVFAGSGVLEKQLRHSASRMLADGLLVHEPIFVFLDKSGLKELAHDSYLCVHAAKMEVEGLGCMEALREGTVPVISQNPYVGTTDYALDERSIFKSGDAKELAERIDWWIEHPEERNRMAQIYADRAREYAISKSAQKLIDMYRLALDR